MLLVYRITSVWVLWLWCSTLRDATNGTASHKSIERPALRTYSPCHRHSVDVYHEMFFSRPISRYRLPFKNFLWRTVLTIHVSQHYTTLLSARSLIWKDRLINT